MKKTVIAAIVASLSTQAMADDLPLRRVVLSTAGLAQFTHSGEVEAGSSVELPVRVHQVDDLLKSLTIFDEQNAIGAVSLPGKAPLSELFRDLPFDAEALESLPALLNALVGSEVEIEGNVSATGRLLKVTEVKTQLPEDRGEVTQHRLTLMTESGLVQAVLEELSSVRFTDPAIQAQIDKALAGLAANRAQERRTLSINLLGDSDRNVGFSYVVAAPVWKTAYRLVLPQDEESNARLQGWAVVENLTGNDWENVELSLVSGNPVALKQPLYTAFYVDRPEIPVTAAQRIVPYKDDAEADLMPQPSPEASAEIAPGVRRRMAKEGSGMLGMFGTGMAMSQMPQEIGGAAQAAEAEEAATQISYSFPEKVSLANGSTMMVPFVDRETGATRSWLYQPQTNARHPLASVKITNNSDTALPAGIITAFERGGQGATNFVGDAQLPLIGKGDTKFVTFALDAKTDIRRTDRNTRQVRLGKVVNGVLRLTTKSIRDIDYEITPSAEESREIVIEELRVSGWEPAEKNPEVTVTPSRFRFTVSAPKGKTTKTSLKLELTGTETIGLVTLSPNRLYATLEQLDNSDAALKETIGRLGEIVQAINDAERKRRELENEIATIAEDQDRIRKNLTSVGQQSDIGRRYLDKLRNQEDRLAEIRQTIKSLESEIEKQREAATELANNLSL